MYRTAYSKDRIDLLFYCIIGGKISLDNVPEEEMEVSNTSTQQW